MSGEVKLLRCPFCGGKAELNAWVMPKTAAIICLGCSNQTCVTFTEDEAVRLWNRRAPGVSREGVARVVCESGLGKVGLCIQPKCNDDPSLCQTVKRITDAVLALLGVKP